VKCVRAAGNVSPNQSLKLHESNRSEGRMRVCSRGRLAQT
jgi:hypothetical protein